MSYACRPAVLVVMHFGGCIMVLCALHTLEFNWAIRSSTTNLGATTVHVIDSLCWTGCTSQTIQKVRKRACVTVPNQIYVVHSMEKSKKSYIAAREPENVAIIRTSAKSIHKGFGYR